LNKNAGIFVYFSFIVLCMCLVSPVQYHHHVEGNIMNNMVLWYHYLLSFIIPQLCIDGCDWLARHGSIWHVALPWQSPVNNL